MKSPRPSDQTARAVRTDPEELGSLLDQLDEAPQDAKSVRRGRRRFRFRSAACTVTIQQSDSGAATALSVPTRNLSAGGMSFLHGGFVHSGSKCIVQLATRDGGVTQVRGSIVRCRYIGDWLHEVSVKFDEVIDPAMFCEDASRLRVLLIDDDPKAIESVGAYLAECGGELIAAGEGKVALQHLAVKPHDCIIMDVEMTEGDGFAVLAEIRTFGYGGPIVVVTAHTGDGEQQRAEEAGCTLWLAKPYSSELLKSLFQDLMKAA